MTTEQNPENPRKFEFTHPNSGINEDLILHGDHSGSIINQVTTDTDGESFELNFEEFKHTLPLCYVDILGDNFNYDTFKESSSDSSSNLHCSSCVSAESKSSSTELLQTPTKDVPRPLFTGKITEAEVQQAESLKIRPPERQPELQPETQPEINPVVLPESNTENADLMSLMTGSTVSGFLKYEAMTLDTNIFSAIRNATDDNIEERKLFKNVDNITVENPMNHKLFVENDQVDSSRVFGHECVGSSSRSENNPKPEKDLMDINATSAKSRGFAQLLFLSLIQVYKTASSKKLSETLLAKQDAQVQLSYTTRLQLSLATNLGFLFKDNKSSGEYKKLHSLLFKRLSVVFANQKLYIDTRERGEIINVIYYPFREWRMIEFSSMKGTRQTAIIKGDGWSSDRVPGTVDFKIITKSSNRSWTRELFKPIIMFPKLDRVLRKADPDTLLNYFSPLLSIIPGTKNEVEKYSSKNGSPVTLQDILEAKPINSRKNLSKALLKVVETYVYGHYNSIRIRNSEIKRIEGTIHEQFNEVLDAVVDGYIEAFNFMDSFDSLEKHGSDEIYVKIYEFYKMCPVVDLGNLLLQAVGTPTLNEVIFKRKMRGEESLQIMEFIILRNYMKTDSLTLGYLRLMVAYIQSPYITKYILRRLLFWADNIKMNKLTYVRNFTWFKGDPHDFKSQVLLSIRDQAIAHFKAQGLESV